MNEKEKILIETAKEYFNFGGEGLKKGNYNSCVVLYFKALTAFIDLYLLKLLGKSPSSHTERFRITQTKFPEIYNLLDKDFPFYQDSYIQKMSKELAEVIKEDAKTMAKKNQIKL